MSHFYLNPSKMIYIVNLQQSGSLIIPCSWGYSPNRFQQILQFKTKYGQWISIINQHYEQHPGHVIKAWTSNYTISNQTAWYYGLELSFPPLYYDLIKNDDADGAVSSYGLYRCASFVNRTYTKFPDDVSGSAFVISIEGIIYTNTTCYNLVHVMHLLCIIVQNPPKSPLIHP